MIQKARSIKSQSFLRELATALFVIEDEAVLDKILILKDEVLQKRADPDIVLTGERNLKRFILIYLHSLKKEINTVNIWCRTLKYDYKSIKQLRQKIFLEFKLNKIEGVCEIHLQDREIFSPHIQFVGNRAKLAQEILAKIVVDLGYEMSLSEAKGLKETQAFKKYEKAPKVIKLKPSKILSKNLQIDLYEQIEKQIKDQKEIFLASIKRFRAELFEKKEIKIVQNYLKELNEFKKRIYDDNFKL